MLCISDSVTIDGITFESNEPRDMEPPDGCKSFTMQIQLPGYTYITQTQHCSVVSLMQSALRIRGGGPTDEYIVERNGLDVPLLNGKHLVVGKCSQWDFNDAILYPLNVILGNTHVKDHSLLSCVKMTDPGGLFGMPARAVCMLNPNDEANKIAMRDNRQRTHAAFYLLLKYLYPKGHIRNEAIKLYEGDGVLLYAVIVANGSCPVPSLVKEKRNDMWNRMAIDELNMVYDQSTLELWADIVRTMGDKIGKNGVMQFDKFLDGLPKWFSAQREGMKVGPPLYPPTYGGIAVFAHASFSGTAHPHAGAVDIRALARSRKTDWLSHMKRHAIKKGGPYGMVRSVEGIDPTKDPLYLNVMELSHVGDEWNAWQISARFILS